VDIVRPGFQPDRQKKEGGTGVPVINVGGISKTGKLLNSNSGDLADAFRKGIRKHIEFFVDPRAPAVSVQTHSGVDSASQKGSRIPLPLVDSKSSASASKDRSETRRVMIPPPGGGGAAVGRAGLPIPTPLAYKTSGGTGSSSGLRQPAADLQSNSKRSGQQIQTSSGVPKASHSGSGLSVTMKSFSANG
jgi:hypothetical protein